MMYISILSVRLFQTRNKAYWEVLKPMTIPDSLKRSQIPVTKYVAVKCIALSGSVFAIISKPRSGLQFACVGIHYSPLLPNLM